MKETQTYTINGKTYTYIRWMLYVSKEVFEELKELKRELGYTSMRATIQHLLDFYRHGTTKEIKP